MSTNQTSTGEELLAFFRGEYVPLGDARVSVMTHALHYATAVFEGIRGNWNEEKALYIFSSCGSTTSACSRAAAC